ncbi:MAG TPA: phosphoenolpyruvate synthase, partial [Bryobacteraceae bacterium]|nr:phosphoenolpyruvate synthase [Bryobacteraceae bacterium]
MREQAGCYVLGFAEIDRTLTGVGGGKAANLGELSRMDGVRVPAGFCVTTDAFRRIMADAPSIEDRLDALSRARVDDREAIRAISAEIRGIIEGITIPEDVAAAIAGSLVRLGEREAFAVRSSATAEDLPTASFAGQHDTYLNVTGPAAILDHVRRCWASLFTERAVSYRMRIGIDHRKVQMAVVVQRMVFPQAAGVLFTADPVTGNRKVALVEASSGLGEALVSGLVNPDVYRVRDGEVIARAADAPLTDEQVLRLASPGRRIETHFGFPQDIEWCLADGDFHIVQSRPITTLFPIPARDDRENHVYVSTGHQQMMTDAHKPLGLSVRQVTAARPMYEAGGRLFVDVTRDIASPRSRARLMNMLGKSDPLIGDALETILQREGFILPVADKEASGAAAAIAPGTATPIETDPAIVAGLIARDEASIAALQREIRTKSGPALIDFIVADIREMQRILFDPQSHQAILAGIEASWWLNEHLQAWLGEKNAADTLTLSAPGNVTSEMGLALLDVADAIRPHVEVAAFLEQSARSRNENFLDELPRLAGGREAGDAIQGWLDRYGMRCAGEIDITRPRWSERPSTLLPVILSNVRNFEPGEGKRRFAEGQDRATRKEQELLERLRTLPDGEQKAEETKRMIDRVRTFIGYREYPKYGIVQRYFVYKEALMEEAGRLAEAGVVRDREDIFYLTLEELRDAMRTNGVDERVIRERRDAFRSYQALTPPRVLTSDGEAIGGAYRRGKLPPGALAG